MKSDQIKLSEPARFWLFAVAQALLWTLLPFLVFRNLPLDVVEGLVWGHGWPLGTYKHPPLQAWVLESAAIAGGRSDAAIYALGGACLLLAYWALWRLGQQLLAPSAALMGVFVLGACFYFTATIPEFNPNVVQLPLFALCGLFFWQGNCWNRWRDWIGLGLCAGLGLLAKYSFLFLLLSFPLYLIVEPAARRLLALPGPWLAAALAGLVFLPHFYWLVGNNGLPFSYAQSRLVPAANLWVLLGYLAQFALTQLLVLSPMALLAWLARRHEPPLYGDGRRYLDVLAWAPFALTLLSVLLAGGKPRDMWGMALWPFFGLWLALRFFPAWEASAWARRLLVTVWLAIPLCVVAGSLYSVPYGFRPWRTSFPGKELARLGESLWQSEMPTEPLRVIISDTWYGGNVAWYGRDRPQILIEGNPFISPWAQPLTIYEHGALVVWDTREGREAVPDWALQYGQPVVKIIPKLTVGAETVPFGLAIIGPRRR